MSSIGASSVSRAKRSERSGGSAGQTSGPGSGSTARITGAPNANAAAAAKSTIAAAASSVATNGGAANEAPAPTPTLVGGRLVFGLSSRTNKLKHDEYAELRGRQQQQQQSQLLKPTGGENSAISALTGSNIIRQQQQQIGAQRKGNNSETSSSNKLQQNTMNENGSSPSKSTQAASMASSGSNCVGQQQQQPVTVAATSNTAKPEKKIRASKYGNFYKPQDLVVPAAAEASVTAPSSNQQPQVSASGQNSKQQQPLDNTKKPSSAATVKSRRAGTSNKSPDRRTASNTKEPLAKETKPTAGASGRRRSISPAKAAATGSSSSSSAGAPGVSAGATPAPALAQNKQPSVGATSGLCNAVAAGPATGQVGAVKEAPTFSFKPRAKSTVADSLQSSSISSQFSQAQAQTQPQSQQQQQQQQQQAKTQFSIPPPPKANPTLSNNNSSVVSYAKSRIYNKAPKTHLSNRPAGSGSLLLDSGNIPASILSGIKPPKQVNVSRARERWEGGEPFARCKSRQRLAASKGRKLQLYGAWCMTSVVATQQLQLQQALANSSSRANLQRDGSSSAVKVLTRGSVLERIQQYEKAPGLVRRDKSEYDDDDEEEEAAYITIDRSLEPMEVRPNSPTSKQAIYKTRVSSIQSSEAHPMDPLAMLSSGTCAKGALLASSSASSILSSSGNSNSSSGSSSPPINLSSTKSQSSMPMIKQQQHQQQQHQQQQQQAAGQPAQVRRLSLRRRSSVSKNSSTQSIPRFYHPNGKPNTYEIELQKKNIVACFDKFPDRKALLNGPNYRRHFHSIALACGFSEYFKEPLYLYVKHQMTESNLLHNPSTARKQSNAGLTNGTSQQATAAAASGATISQATTNNTQQQATTIANRRVSQPQIGGLKPLTRAASVDTSTMQRLGSQTHISCEQFLICWRNMIATCFDNSARFVHLLTLGKRSYLLPDDFVPLIQSIIDDHPGLKFLRAAPDFHMRYIQTVIARIYFCINKSWTGKISLSELRHSNLLAVLQVLSQEEDINQITDYFSYEHFYVIYCKFWSLDQDHDLLISKEDLARHNDAAISSRIIDRIFMGIVSKQIQQTGKMSYSDFVWFLIAEEDKKHPRSIEYWFRLMDLDGDGYISMYEMEYFYYEQMKRLELMNIEALPFLDSACQILDLVNPKEKNKISLSDLKRTRMATIFFDTFINLEKYLEHESREFVSTRDIVQDGVIISDWDRYASEEYESLVTEETSV